LSVIQNGSRGRTNPLNVVEAVASQNGWTLEGTGEDEIVLLVKGSCTDYQIFFTWMRSLEILHLACVFNIKIPELRCTEMQQLVGRINEQLWLGHFDLWTPDDTILFRQSLPLIGGVRASIQQCEAMLGAALDACERYYPAFQCVLADTSAREAMRAVLFETTGEA